MSNFECRYIDCSKTFADRSNWRRHELNKRIAEHHGDLVLHKQRRKKIPVPVFDADRSVWCCPRPDCPVSSGEKSNVQRHINYNCSSKILRSKKSQENQTCPYCKMQFTQKSNRKQHSSKRYKRICGLCYEQCRNQQPKTFR